MNSFEGYRTIIASIVALVGALLKQSGVEIDQEGVTTAVMTIGGAAAAIHYRFKATKIHAKVPGAEETQDA